MANDRQKKGKKRCLHKETKRIDHATGSLTICLKCWKAVGHGYQLSGSALARGVTTIRSVW